jgi:hypothetical protein
MWQSAASAQTASATITSQQLGANNFKYTLSLTNTSTDTNISTFWFGWVDYVGFIYDLMPNPADTVVSPSNWFGGPIADSIYGGNSVEWYTGTPLTPGSTVSGFSFDSPDSLPTFQGTSPVFGLYPTLESEVYVGEAQSISTQTDPGFIFGPSVLTPEPCTALLAAPALLLMRRRRRD